MLQEASGAAGHPSYRRYHYGSGPLLVEDGGSRRFISTDALGSTTDLTTTGATVATMRKYDAWGQYRNDTAPVASEPKLGFTGHQYDPETGLVYARARYYDPDLGRFISRDINEGSIANAPSLHRFAYARGNPTVYVDQDGRSATAVGTALGFAWGTGQAIGGLISLGLQELTGGAVVSNISSVSDALGLVAQNTIGGFEVGLSLDMAAASGGLAVAAGSGALGFAGADALTLQGKSRSASDFAISQVVEGGKGAAVGVGLGVVGKGVSAVAKTAVGEFVVREAVEAVGAVAKTSAGQAVTGAARATAAKVVPALRALGAEADAAAVDVGLGWMPNAGKSVTAKFNAVEVAAKQELAAAWKEARTPWTGPQPAPAGTPRAPGPAYRQGTFADPSIGWEGNYVKGRQWARDNPLATPDYAKKYGLPAENTGEPDWVVRGRIEDRYTSNPAPASHNNPVNTGGGIEVQPEDPSKVLLDWFHMPDKD